MASILSSTDNTRPILPDSFRFIRSDVPDKLTEPDIQWLLEHNVTTVIDLREDAERQHRRCILEGIPGFLYYSMSVTGGNAVPEKPEDVSKSYIHMVDKTMEKIIDTIWTAPSNVIYFCTAGKDRTGVVSALLLSKMHMPRAYIVEDYLKSAGNLRERLEAFACGHPEVDLAVITPQKRYMEEFLGWLNGKMEPI